MWRKGGYFEGREVKLVFRELVFVGGDWEVDELISFLLVLENLSLVRNVVGVVGDK